MRKKNKILFIYNKDKGGGAEDVMSNLFSRFQKDHDNIDKFLTHQKNNKVVSILIKFRIVRILVSISSLIKYCVFYKTRVISALHEENLVACILFNRPILTVHNSEMPQGIKYLFIYILYQYLAPFKKARVICVSRGLLNMYRTKFTNCSCELIYNGIDILDKDINISECSDKVLMIGRFVNQKNHITGIKIFQEAFKYNNNLSMTIVGEGPLLSDYIEYINNHKLQDKIKILGWSDNIELIYRTHNVLLFPSKFEGFGNVLVEALYCGLSVVASDCNWGPREILSSYPPDGVTSEFATNFEIGSLININHNLSIETIQKSAQVLLKYNQKSKAKVRDAFQNQVHHYTVNTCYQKYDNILNRI